MDTQHGTVRRDEIDALYDEAGDWHLNTGGETIHAKRMGGRYRRLKWLAASVWLVYFLGPYVRWDNRQAVLFDIPNRQYHIFGATVLPQDFWMLSLLLLFFAILLAVVTATAGRVFCGYFCFQTVWTDIFTLIEDKLEGSPLQRRRLDAAPWGPRKVALKVVKHALWLLISVLTGITFTLWFSDAFVQWKAYLDGTAYTVAWIAVAVFGAFGYFFAGFMREQVCFWLCPYARLQGVMCDRETILPTYDLKRGEPRGRLKKGDKGGSDIQGDCIDCHQCVAVCPTGIDIRNGQQEGCITCGLCIDACDAVMEKTGRPRGLIRYASLDEMEGKPAIPLLRRPRVILYSTILIVALAGIIYGLSTLSKIQLIVLHARQPLYVLQSDGSIQNKYVLKVLNKTANPLDLIVQASGPEGLRLLGAEEPLHATNDSVTAVTVFLRLPRAQIHQSITPVQFHLSDPHNARLRASRASIFAGPAG